MTLVYTKVDSEQQKVQANSCQYCAKQQVLTGFFGMVILRDAGMDSDQGGFGAAEGASQQLPVLREAADFGMRILQDAGRDQGGWSVADCPRHQLAVLLRKF